MARGRRHIALELAVAGSIRLGGPTADGDALYWLEQRPQDGGRATLVRREPRTTTTEDVSPAGVNVRTRVHEYGGGAYLVAGDLLVVSDFATGRLLRVGADRSGTPITPEGAWRYADFVLDGPRGAGSSPSARTTPWRAARRSTRSWRSRSTGARRPTRAP